MLLLQPWLGFTSINTICSLTGTWPYPRRGPRTTLEYLLREVPPERLGPAGELWVVKFCRTSLRDCATF